MVLADFDPLFEIAVMSLLPKNWIDETDETTSLSYSIVRLVRAKNSIAHQQEGKKYGHIGYAVQMYLKDHSLPEGQRIKKSTWVYVDKKGKMLS
ncbi:hypothetical protein NVP2275O_087 [Vibrio phage 2.275.O._10N.286.54.E11]|nr:hypothetical protein NVP2275O_087 [Vibrio phage 2.275.O._10N.286.54.E11]